jgi:hypothetical protein
MTGRMVQAVERLLCNGEVLSSSSSLTKKKRKESIGIPDAFINFYISKQWPAKILHT